MLAHQSSTSAGSCHKQQWGVQSGRNMLATKSELDNFRATEVHGANSGEIPVWKCPPRSPTQMELTSSVLSSCKLASKHIQYLSHWNHFDNWRPSVRMRGLKKNTEGCVDSDVGAEINTSHDAPKELQGTVPLGTSRESEKTQQLHCRTIGHPRPRFPHCSKRTSYKRGPSAGAGIERFSLNSHYVTNITRCPQEQHNSEPCKASSLRNFNPERRQKERAMEKQFYVVLGTVLGHTKALGFHSCGTHLCQTGPMWCA